MIDLYCRIGLRKQNANIENLTKSISGDYTATINDAIFRNMYLMSLEADSRVFLENKSKLNEESVKMTTTMTAMEAYTLVEQAAAKANQEVRKVSKIEPGQSVRQGDIYLVCLDPNTGQGKTQQGRQLAPGISAGSRHVLSGRGVLMEAVTNLKGVNSRALFGPRIYSPDERVLVEHPEHAHLDLPPGQYQVLHQLDFAAQRRVQD